MPGTESAPIPPAIFLMGPTASGKTALACALYERFPLGLISVDSTLVYRGLDIGTAKPNATILERYPHALLDLCDPSQPYSAAKFRSDALTAMQEITDQGRVPLLVGGTGLYFRALERGLSPLPAADPKLRKRLTAEALRDGWTALHARLAQWDPLAAQRIHASDTQRIQRALEVITLTGKPLSAQQQGGSAALPYRLLKLVLLPTDRVQLHARIAERFAVMLEQGFLDEVRGLRARKDLDASLPALRAVGYRQAWSYLSEQVGEAAFRQAALAATRQLAKRQMTWLRGESNARRLDPFADDLLEQAVHAVQSMLQPAHFEASAKPRTHRNGVNS
ncbi:MAG TPA: tRNA (adenosine(37)-N6)-dimethylallyltransferase MiaA [Mizugakiibacter sp.]|nr:tRNA (adenosine(37)-N6)-dimethylallyltransferase MiaA [Mizugakiibacter sp.]